MDAGGRRRVDPKMTNLALVWILHRKSTYLKRKPRLGNHSRIRQIITPTRRYYHVIMFIVMFFVFRIILQNHNVLMGFRKLFS